MATEVKNEIWVLPSEMVLTFVAAYRTLEKCMNPIFSFPTKCSKCGKLSDAMGNQGPHFVKSKKTRNGEEVIIGIQCKTEGCNMVLKFEKPISPGDPDFPQRLKKQPTTALTMPTGKEGDVEKKYMETINHLLELS